MSIGRTLFIAGWLVLGLFVIGRGGNTTASTWLPESSQFARSRLLMEPGMQLPQGCGAISLDAQFQDALAQNAGQVAVYGAFTTRQHSVFFDQAPKDLLAALRNRVSDSNSPVSERVTVLVLSDPPNMGCEISVYAVSDGNSLREMSPVALSAPSSEVAMTILKVAQLARNSSMQQVAHDSQFSENLRNGLILVVVSGVLVIVCLVGLTEYGSHRQINKTNEHARAVFEKNKAAWQERIANLSLKYSQFNEFVPYLDRNSPEARKFQASFSLLGYFVEAGASRIAEITAKASSSAMTKADYEQLTAELNDGFVLQLQQPWYEGSPFEPDVKAIKLNLASYERYATEVFAYTSQSYKAMNGIAPNSIDHLLPPG